MTSLNLSNNQLTYIPATLQYLPGVKRLNFSGNLLGVKSRSVNQRSKEGSERGMGVGRGHTVSLSNQGKDQDQNRISSSFPIVEAFPPILTALDISHNQLDSIELSIIIQCLLLLKNNHHHAPPVKSSHTSYPPISQGGGGAAIGAVPPGGGRVAATPTSFQV